MNLRKIICPNCNDNLRDKETILNDHFLLEQLKREVFCKCRTEYGIECCSCQTKLECYLKGHKCECSCFTVEDEGKRYD